MRIAAVVRILIALLCAQSLLGQETEPRWFTGKGTAQGTNIGEMRLKALNAARADALKKAGVVVRAIDLGVKSETNQTLTDFFTRFAESSTRGLILDERNIKVGKPIPVSDSLDEFNTSYRIEIQLEALVALQVGETDPGFEVKLISNRDAYTEEEPVHLTISSTRDGFLTLFSIENDSLTVLFPNSLAPNDSIKAGTRLSFPLSEAYSLSLSPLRGQERSEVTFVAVVSKERVPFSEIEEAKYEGLHLKLTQAMLTNYAKWLYKIPVHERCSDAKVVGIAKRHQK